MGVRADQGATTMRKLASVLVLLAVVGVGQAGEKAILKGIVDRGGTVSENEDGLSICMPPTTTDADLGELCELRRLRILSICDTEVTDKGLRTLESLDNLRSLHMMDCPNITVAGFERWKKAQPGRAYYFGSLK